jgi:hypothetical protein
MLYNSNSWNLGRDEMMETVKRSVVTRASVEGRMNRWNMGGLQGSEGALYNACGG